MDDNVRTLPTTDTPVATPLVISALALVGAGTVVKRSVRRIQKRREMKKFYEENHKDSE